MRIQFDHVISVSSDIVGGARKAHQEEEEHDELEPAGSSDSKGNAGKGGSQKHLHCYHPPSLCLEYIDERAPKGLHYPRKLEPTGVERYLGVRHTHL